LYRLISVQTLQGYQKLLHKCVVFRDVLLIRCKIKLLLIVIVKYCGEHVCICSRKGCWNVCRKESVYVDVLVVFIYTVIAEWKS